jgi:nicotinamidase-related amidase
LGFRTIFLEDCSRGIDPADIKDTLERVKASHGVVVNSNEVRGMLPA